MRDKQMTHCTESSISQPKTMITYSAGFFWRHILEKSEFCNCEKKIFAVLYV